MIIQVYVKGAPVKAVDAVSGKTAQERRDELKARAAARKKATGDDWGADE